VSFRVVILDEAREDLLRLSEFLFDREPARDGDLTLPEQAMATIQGALQMLERHPYTCRKIGDSPFWRELVISFGRTGFVAQFQIAAEDLVLVAAIRHQREDDYH
jgi:plasmid stabilization system protein ParE